MSNPINESGTFGEERFEEFLKEQKIWKNKLSVHQDSSWDFISLEIRQKNISKETK